MPSRPPLTSRSGRGHSSNRCCSAPSAGTCRPGRDRRPAGRDATQVLACPRPRGRGLLGPGGQATPPPAHVSDAAALGGRRSQTPRLGHTGVQAAAPAGQGAGAGSRYHASGRTLWVGTGRDLWLTAGTPITVGAQECWSRRTRLTWEGRQSRWAGAGDGQWKTARVADWWGWGRRHSGENWWAGQRTTGRHGAV